MKNLVTVIIPCYNMALKINRMFDSLLSQTYQNLEIIAVDDGSIDNSKQVINGYIPIFKEKGISLKYIYQQNKGLGGAINTGLKHISGDFLCWVDADDFLMPDSIEKRLAFLLNKPEYGLVRSDYYVYLENDLTKPIRRGSGNYPSRFKEEGLFEDYLRDNHVTYCCGCHMIRMSSLRKVNPNLDIFEAPRGQNIQMLLPMVYKYKEGFIDECLYGYIVYGDSMSSGDDTYEKSIERIEGINEIKRQTLNRITFDNNEKAYYEDIAEQFYYYKKAICAYSFHHYNDFDEYQSKVYDKQYRKSLRIKYLRRRIAHLIDRIKKTFGLFSHGRNQN